MNMVYDSLASLSLLYTMQNYTFFKMQHEVFCLNVLRFVNKYVLHQGSFKKGICSLFFNVAQFRPGSHCGIRMVRGFELVTFSESFV